MPTQSNWCQASCSAMWPRLTGTAATGMTLRCTTTVIFVNFKRLSNLIHHKLSRFTICLPSLHCTTIDNCKCKLLYFKFQPTAQSYSCSLTHLLLHATSNLEPAYDDNNTWLRISRSHYALRIGYTIPNANIHARWLALDRLTFCRQPPYSNTTLFTACLKWSIAITQRDWLCSVNLYYVLKQPLQGTLH
jgi:hypothetical protein